MGHDLETTSERPLRLRGKKAYTYATSYQYGAGRKANR